ncbi:MAG: 3'(2'),5'-bisphosphate nucleotidase CysQ [Lewinellaceae bacterium]|nr:3'(2'),5'-bisphosphate nucleotidase CysQ [Lewinellaceae bacterium]
MIHPYIPGLLEIGRNAADEILNIYAQENLFVEIKGDNSPLTAADRAAHKIIKAGLTNLTPEIPMVSEEDESNWSTMQWPVNEKYWVIDPLDGTKEFIKRNGEFSVNIALVENGYPIVTVVVLPAHYCTYYAASGKGSFRLDWGSGQTEQIKAKPANLQDQALRVVVSRSHLDDTTKSILAGLNEPVPTPLGGSMKFTRISEGLADFYPRFGPTMAWDTAAPQLVLEEAGGHLLDWETKQRKQYLRQGLKNGYFVAAGKLEGLDEFMHYAL